MPRTPNNINYHDIPRRVNRGDMSMPDAETVLMESPYKLEWDYEKGKYVLETKKRHKR